MAIINSVWVRFWIVAVLSIPIIVLSLIEGNILPIVHGIEFMGEPSVLLTLTSIIYVIIIISFFKLCFSEIRARSPGIGTVIVLSSTLLEIQIIISQIAETGSPLYFDFAAVIDLLFLNYLLYYSTYDYLVDTSIFTKKIPAQATIILGQDQKTVRVDSLHEGDIILVKKGEIVSCDGIIIDGNPTIKDSFFLNGYTSTRTSGARVTAGSLCTEGSAYVKVTHCGPFTYFSKVRSATEKQFAIKSKLQKKIDKYGTVLFFFSLTVCLLQFIVSYLFLKNNVALSLQKTITLLVITGSFSSYFAVQLCVYVSIRKLAMNGIIVNNRESFEQSRLLDTIVFDRTGTLTEERFGLTDIVVFNQRLTKDELLKFAASVERNYGNPIARAIVEFSMEFLPVTNSEYYESKGVVGLIDSKRVQVVNDSYLIEKGLKYDTRKHTELREGGKTVVYVVIDDEIFGAIILTDVIRADARTLIKSLKKRKVATLIMTSDTKDAAHWIANELQLDNYVAEVQKNVRVERIKDFQSKGHIVGVTGNEKKDLDLLKQADVGFALGTGFDTDFSAPILHYYRKPIDILKVLKMSDLNHRKITENVIWIIIYTISTTAIASGIFTNWRLIISPSLGAFLSLLATIVVLLNSRFSQRIK